MKSQSLEQILAPAPLALRRLLCTESTFACNVQEGFWNDQIVSKSHRLHVIFLYLFTTLGKFHRFLLNNQ